MSETQSNRPGATHAIALIAGREIRERLRAKSYLVLTALLVVIIIGIGVIGRIASGGDGAEPARIGVTEPVAPTFTAGVAQAGEALGRELEVVPIADATDARQAVEDGGLDLAVVGDAEEMVFADDVDDELAAAVQQAWSSAQIREELIDAGLEPGQVDAVLGPASLAVIALGGSDDGGDDGLAILTGTLVSIMLFVSLQTFGGYVLVGVVEEKSTAVVELLLARVRADQLLAGKVIGIGATALLQFAVAAAAGTVALAISGTEVPGEIWSTLPIAIVWFLGGYAFYSTLFALAGSLVSRQEDAQAASAPILTVMIAAYLAVFVLGYVPDSTASTVMSLIPPFAPFLMPMRMAAGAASVVEIVVSLALLIIGVLAVWRLAGTIYRQVLLRRGSRITWGDALGLLRSGDRASTG